MAGEHYRAKIMETELVQPTENGSPRQTALENFKPGKSLFRRSQDHRWLGDSTQEGKVNFIRLGYLNENRAKWGY